MEYIKSEWKYSTKLSGSENHKGFVVRDAIGWMIADVTPITEDGGIGEAHAKLISAAPHLLHIAKRVVFMLGNYPDGTMGKELANEAALAIKKATE